MRDSTFSFKQCIRVMFQSTDEIYVSLLWIPIRRKVPAKTKNKFLGQKQPLQSPFSRQGHEKTDPQVCINNDLNFFFVSHNVPL